MITFKPISLEDKHLFDKYLKSYRFLTCEYTFTSLFIWRKGCNIEYAIVDNALIIKKTGFDNSTYFMQPIGFTSSSLTDIIHKLSIYKTEHNMDYLFKDAESPFIFELNEAYPEKFLIEEDRNNFDYIYNTSDLINLSGRRYHGQKNHYNYFKNNYKYDIVPITKGVVSDCISVAREWCYKNDCKDFLLYELYAIEEILNHEEELDFNHMAVYVEDKLSAFTIGERVNSDMCIIHIEKADDSIQGLYNFVNRTFLETEFSHVPFVNREQDLGIEGLRRAKLSYHPFKLEPKYSVK
jgi:uncharacterized protein